MFENHSGESAFFVIDDRQRLCLIMKLFVQIEKKKKKKKQQKTNKNKNKSISLELNSQLNLNSNIISNSLFKNMYHVYVETRWNNP